MKLSRPLVLFSIGGLSYILIELMWRGYSHWTMFFVGGICFVLVGYINEWFTFEIPLIKQMAISAILITIVEFIAGCILNLWLNLNIWDYSLVPLNILGQICVPYIFLWFLLSFVCILLDDYIRYYLYNEEKPHYKFF